MLGRIKTMKLRYKIGMGVATGAVVLAGGGAAFAYFTTSGNGTGATAVGSAGSFSVTQGPIDGNPLTPGGSSDSIPYVVTNNGHGAANLATVVISVANPDGSAWSVTNDNGTCSSADFAIGTSAAGSPFTDTSAAGDIPGTDAGSNTSDGSFTIKMVDRAANQDGCEGLTPPLYYSASS